MKDLIKLIKKSNKIALFSHIGPDPDTIGSTMAIFYALKTLKKDVFMFCDDEGIARFSFLNADTLFNQTEFDDSFDLAIGIDVASKERVGENYCEQFSKIKHTAKIDHHPRVDDYGDVNVVEFYPACAILVYDIIKKLKIKITNQIATLLYFGVCGDTGCFRFNNTNALAFEISAKLVKFGANIRFLYDNFFDKKTVSGIRLTSRALADAKVNDEFGYVVLTITQQDFENAGAPESETVGNLPNVYLNAGYKMGLIVKEKDGRVKASLRSKKDYDCSAIAEKYGGGGHKNASGILLAEGISLDEAKNLLESDIQKYLKNLQEEN